MKKAPTKCRHCGEREEGQHGFFSGWYDEECYAFPLAIDTPPEQVPPGIRWMTVCNACGEEVR